MSIRALFLTVSFFFVMPVVIMAQDDLYFVPKTKAQKQAEQEAYEKALLKRHYRYVKSRRDVDEYNRRAPMESTIENIQEDGTADDIIDFDGETGVYPDSVAVDTAFSSLPEAGAPDEDFTYSRRLSRFENFMPWYTATYPWYDSWYGLWADPWYDPWFYGYRGYRFYWRSAYWGWYDPWYNDYYGFYSPWFSSWYYPYYGWAWRAPYDGYAYYGHHGGHGHGYGYHGGATLPHFGTGRSSLAGRTTTVRDRRHTGNQKNPNLTSGRSRNSSYNAQSRFNRSSATLTIPQQSGTVNRSATSSWGSSGSGSFSRSGGFGGSHGGGGSFGGGSRGGGGGFGGRR